MSFPVLLAFDVGEVLWVLFVIVAIISGFINKMKEKKAADEVARRRVQAGGARRNQGQLQDEISQFLEELGAAEPKPAPRPQPQRKRPKPQRQSQSRPKPRSRRESEEPQTADRRRSQSTRQKPGDHELGSVRSRHVESSVEERHLGSHVGEHRPGTIAEEVLELADSQTAAVAAARLPPVAQLLARQDGLANAVMLNEILSPPVSRRDSHRR
ncbi:MAG: hypothetical protein ACYTGL_10060 [Planctomycetota bacterium]|jgi:ATP-dependent exoDNAse (exonuclease V) beta subunit